MLQNPPGRIKNNIMKVDLGNNRISELIRKSYCKFIFFKNKPKVFIESKIAAINQMNLYGWVLSPFPIKKISLVQNDSEKIALLDNNRHDLKNKYGDFQNIYFCGFVFYNINQINFNTKDILINSNNNLTLRSQFNKGNERKQMDETLNLRPILLSESSTHINISNLFFWENILQFSIELDKTLDINSEIDVLLNNKSIGNIQLIEIAQENPLKYKTCKYSLFQSESFKNAIGKFHLLTLRTKDQQYFFDFIISKTDKYDKTSHSKLLFNKNIFIRCESFEYNENQIYFHGWCLSMLGLKSIELFIEDNSIGEAKLNLARRDVGNLFPEVPNSNYSGFTFKQKISRDIPEISSCKVVITNNQNQKFRYFLPLNNSHDQLMASTKIDQYLEQNKSYIDSINLLNNPLVSIITVTWNGEGHLRRLLDSIYKNTIYPNYEILIVDNNSTDNTWKVIEDFENKLSLRIINNPDNTKNFSENNNIAAKQANGEFLVFINNDIEVTYGWLKSLVYSYYTTENPGIIGSKLLYPENHPEINKSHKIQHCGVDFKFDGSFFRGYHIYNGENFDVEDYSKPISRPVVTAALLLISKDLFNQIGCFDENYNYGYEDVDLNLKVKKLGYNIFYDSHSKALHYEFGTQNLNDRESVANRRRNNYDHFQKKWHLWLKKEILKSKINCDNDLSSKPLKFAFAVTETGDNATAGDLFTAKEIASSLNRLGYETVFLSRREHQWYDLDESIDVIISLLDAYDPRKIKGARKDIITIAWLRNWFDRWQSYEGFKLYDILLCSSKKSIKYLESKGFKNSYLFPIASNPERFNDNIKPNEEFMSDYCFTGSNWDNEREIAKFLKPDKINFKFNLYGKHWNNHKDFKPYLKGFVSYDKMPEIYKSTKLLIDDANKVTKPFGSVNSRVFDALAAGTLVITNGIFGANELFEGKLPVYQNTEELHNLINFYLQNDNEREILAKELKKIVLENHTYDIRANQLIDNIEDWNNKYKIAIKVPAPKWESVHEWGDYHFAIALKSEFERLGHRVIIQILPEWDNDEDALCDVVIVLRGLSRYKPKPKHVNIMWNISHPDKVDIQEYNEYDHVFVSSIPWAEHLNKQTKKIQIQPMLQCVNDFIFDYNKAQSASIKSHDILFVGNSRKIFRKIVKDMIPTEHDFAVYGTLWNEYIDKKYYRGEHIPNSILPAYYSKSKILLNDHWDDMKEKGFISNRIFDGFAVKSFIISDKVNSYEEIFGDALVTYETKEELHELIEYYLNNPEERKEKAEKGYNIVTKNHTFRNRVLRFLEEIEELMSKRNQT